MKQIFLLDLNRSQPAPTETSTGVAPATSDKNQNADNSKDDIHDSHHRETSHAPVAEEERSRETDEAVPDGWAGQLKVVLRRESSASDLREKAFFENILLPVSGQLMLNRTMI
jgi:hypothetical protein